MPTFQKFNKAAEFDARLDEKKEILNQEVHKKAIKEMDKAMADVRREFKMKESKSLSSASKVVLTS